MMGRRARNLWRSRGGIRLADLLRLTIRFYNQPIVAYIQRQRGTVRLALGPPEMWAQLPRL